MSDERILEDEELGEIFESLYDAIVYMGGGTLLLHKLENHVRAMSKELQRLDEVEYRASEYVLSTPGSPRRAISYANLTKVLEGLER